MHSNRRQFLLSLVASAAASTLPKIALAGDSSRLAVIGAAWRGPDKRDPYFAGTLVADWETRKLSIRHAASLPGRPHGLLPEADGGILVIAARPGSWLLRCDASGEITQQVQLETGPGQSRLNGHAVLAANGDVVYTTETDHSSGRGRISVRDRQNLKKLDEWDSHGIDPHQLVLHHAGHLIVANGGVPRTLADKKHSLERMDASVVRIDSRSGKLLHRWQLDDRRLSLRHLAWSETPTTSESRLGIAIQAEHEAIEQRTAAPILAILEGDKLHVPTRANDGSGYAGDIAAAWEGGFVLSSNQAGVAQLWHPGMADRMTAIVKMEEAYALTSWAGPGNGGGVLVATALGLVRSHPTAKALVLAWPQRMALDNHWVLISET